MQTSDVVARISDATGLSQIKVKSVLHELTNMLHEAVQRGEGFAVAGLMRVSTRKVSARKYRQPKTGVEMILPEKIRVDYRAPLSLRKAAQKQLEG